VRVSLPNDFTPRAYQERPMRFFDQGGKKAVWVVHRRGGKDLTAAHQTCKMMHKRTGAYWHIFPSFEQGRKAIWEGFTKDGKRTLENVFPGFLDPKRKGSIVKKKDDQKMLIELKCGSIWRLMGSDRIEVVGAGPVGVVYSEFAISNPKARNLIRPMLRENDGWEFYITTPRGRNHAYDLYKMAEKNSEWFCETQTLFDTRAYDPEKTIAEERAEGMPEPLIQQEYMCDWNAALAGSVWGEQISTIERAGGISEFNHEMEGVFTSWDLGMSDSTAIWFFQIVDGGVDLIDYYEDHGQPLSHYFDLIDAKPYRYVKHWLPHDARQVTLAAGVSILNQMQGHYPGKVEIGPKLHLLDGIQAGRWLLQKGVRLHTRCSEGIEALRQYHYKFDEETKTFSASPDHDWSSHAADSFRYLACVAKVSGLFNPKSPAPPKAPPVGGSMSHRFTLDQLHADRARGIASRKRI
jgi:phage terminase large subunit